MELIDYYLDQVEKVHGVYVLQVDEDLTDEEKHMIWEHWQESNMQQRLFIMPESFSFSFIERYSLYIALMLVRAGKRITRDKWIGEAYPEEKHNPFVTDTITRKSKASYLYLSKEGVMRRMPDQHSEAMFHMTLEDMEAEDYVMLPD